MGILDDEDYDNDLPNSDQSNSLSDIEDFPNITNNNNNDDDDDNKEPIPIASSLSQSPPPKRRRTTTDDEPVPQDVHPTVGRVIHEESTIQQQWHNATATYNTGDINIFQPFNSEIDWRMVQWLIDEGPSQSSNNNLLRILEVSLFKSILRLPFSK